MEQLQEPSQDFDPATDISPDIHAPTHPPKFQKEEEEKQLYTIWLRSLTSLALYLVLGYYIFNSFDMLLLITLIVVFHELGHFFAMKLFRYKDLGIFFIPLLGAYVSGSKKEVSQRESAVILLAGPLPGIIVGSIIFLIWQNDPYYLIGGIPANTVALSFIILNLVNLLPVYPLDGGQLLNRVFLDEESWISKLFVFGSIALMCWFAIFRIGMPYGVLLLFFPAMMLLRLIGDRKLNTVEKKIEEEGINLDQSYEDMSDEDYWKIRTVLVREHPAFQQANPTDYDTREEKIMTTIQSLLHKHLIQDMSLAGKIVVFILCMAAFATPWLLEIDMTFFRRFGF